MLTRRLALAAVLALPAACATPVSDAPVADDAPEWVPEAYQLGAGDKVRVTVFNEPSLTGEFQVSSAGALSLPLIGEVEAAGRTVSELQRAVEAKLRDGYLLDPRVNAEILTYRPFYILGEVGAPGTYPYSAGLTVLNAVATAGGFTYRANTGRVYIRRANATGEVAYRLTSQTRIAPGDTIRIGERLF